MKRFLKIFGLCLAVAVPICYIASLTVTVLLLIRQVPVYRSFSTIRFPPPTQEQTADSYKIALNTEAREMMSSDLIGKAREQLNLRPQEVADRLVRILAYPLLDSQLITLEVDSVDPVLSADFANAMADIFVNTRNIDRQAKVAVSEKAEPAAYPVSHRKIRTLQIASLTGAALGVLVAIVTAGAIVGIHKNKGGEPGH